MKQLEVVKSRIVLIGSSKDRTSEYLYLPWIDVEIHLCLSDKNLSQEVHSESPMMRSMIVKILQIPKEKSPLDVYFGERKQILDEKFKTSGPFVSVVNDTYKDNRFKKVMFVV